jgi:hypothetical protein
VTGAERRRPGSEFYGTGSTRTTTPGSIGSCRRAREGSDRVRTRLRLARRELSIYGRTKRPHLAFLGLTNNGDNESLGDVVSEPTTNAPPTNIDRDAELAPTTVALQGATGIPCIRSRFVNG